MRLNFLLFLFVAFSFVLFLNCSVPIEQQRKMIPSKPFVKEIWQSDDKFDIRFSERPGMARDLIKNKVLIGKNRKEIVELLGEPDSDEEKKSKQMTYELEQLFQRGVDLAAEENLKITFNSTDTVEKAELEFKKIDWRE